MDALYGQWKGNKVRSGRRDLAPPKLECGVGVGEESRGDVTFFASLAGPLCGRCAVCVGHSVWRIEDFAGFDRGTESGPAGTSCFAQTMRALHIATVKFQGVRVPEALQGLQSPSLRPRVLSGPAAWDLPRLAARPGAISFRLLSLCCRRQPWWVRLVRFSPSRPGSNVPAGLEHSAACSSHSGASRQQNIYTTPWLSTVGKKLKYGWSPCWGSRPGPLTAFTRSCFRRAARRCSGRPVPCSQRSPNRRGWKGGLPTQKRWRHEVFLTSLGRVLNPSKLASLPLPASFSLELHFEVSQTWPARGTELSSCQDLRRAAHPASPLFR